VAGGPKLTTFLRGVEKSAPLSMRASALRYSNPFRNCCATDEGGYANFANSASEIGCHSNVPWAISKCAFR